MSLHSWPPPGIEWYYADEFCAIANADCREILPKLPDVDLVLTDPPYEIRAGSGGGVFGERDHLVNTGGFTDGGCDYSFLSGFENWFCFCSRQQLFDLISLAVQCRWNLLTWCKPNPVPTCCNKYLPDVEFVIHGFSRGRLFGEMEDKSSFAVVPCGIKETEHPNEKPLRLVSKLLKLGSQVGETILDPFMGSGTTLVAAKQLGRRCIGIELEEKYCEIAVKRLQQEYLPLSTPEPKRQEQSEMFASALSTLPENTNALNRPPEAKERPIS